MNDNNNGNSYRHILKYTGLFGGIQLLTILVGLVKNKLVAVILGPAGLGLISLFNSSLTLMSNLTGLGLPTSAVRNLSAVFQSGDSGLLEREISTVRTWSLLAALAGTALCALLSGVLSSLAFADGGHALGYLLLSPVVGMTAITGGELAVLKATRRLRRLATISICGVLASVIAVTPIYYIYGLRGVVTGLLVAALLQLLIATAYSWRCHPPRFSFSTAQLVSALPMIRLGVAFVAAGVLTSGAEFAIRTFLNNASELDTVGLYSAGYMIVVTYGGMVFSAMETDYYPRLSASVGKPDFNAVINRQCEVSLLLVAPMLSAFIILVPVVLPLLLSARFSAVSGMVQAALLALYVRAVKLPVAYVLLARGASRQYLAVEAMCAVLTTAFAVAGFCLFGLTGIGFAIVVVGLLEYVVLLIVVSRMCGYRPSLRLRRIMLLHFPAGLAAYALTLTAGGVAYWLAGGLLAVVSTVVSVRFYRRG